MPVLVEGDRGQPRRKRFAPKTRSGCVNCKARRVKCGEEKPACRRCTVSRLPCSYKVPKTWLFDARTDASTYDEGRPSLSTSTTLENDYGDLAGSFYTEQHKTPARVDSPTNFNAWDGPRIFESQHEHYAFYTWVTFLVRHCEPRSRFPADMNPGQDVWRYVIPQIAYHSAALRGAMIACGILVQSVQRKEHGSKYEKSMAMVLRYATRAIRELASNIKPLIETVLTAYTFWSLDLMACNFQSASKYTRPLKTCFASSTRCLGFHTLAHSSTYLEAYFDCCTVMHLLSALKIAHQCRKVLASDELASTFVHGMMCNLPDPEATPPPELDKDPPGVRRMKAVVKLEVEYDRVTACAQRVAVSNTSIKHEILPILEESRQEVQWIIFKYSTPKSYEKWLLHKKQHLADVNRKSSHSDDRPGFYQQLVQNVDDFLAKAETG